MCRPYLDQGPAEWYRMREFVVSLVDNMEVGEDKTRVAVVLFSQESKVVFKLNRYSSKYQVIEAINQLQFEQVGNGTPRIQARA